MGSATAQQPKLLGRPVKPEPAKVQQDSLQQKQHVVKEGDTLWDISRFYFNDPYRWPIIYDANRNVVKNPHWIYPTEKLVIPGLKGDVAAMPVVAMNEELRHSRFFVPTSIDTSASVLTNELARIPLVQEKEWLAAPWISDTSLLHIKAQVYKPFDPRDQNDKLTQKFHPSAKLYVTLKGSAVAKDYLLAIRLTRDMHDMGWMIEPMGILRIDSVAGNTAVASVVNEFGDLKVGDVAIALPAVPRLPLNRPIEVSGGPTGQIITFLNEHPLYGEMDYAFIDLGATKGIAIGDELVAFMPSRQPSAKHPETLPEEPVGKLTVIRVDEHMATARVTGLKNASLEAGLPVRVLRKSP